ncbi:MAG: hypothetical protein U1C19_07590 [Methanobacteriaceae archaeon]|jgi:hypothetical protein|nr:hypothetical protein [Methanobacteriaceae archaeon]
MLNKKYVAIVAIAAIIIISSVGFLIAQPSDDVDCKVCEIPDCKMNHTSNSSDDVDCKVCGMTDCKMNHTTNSTN